MTQVIFHVNVSDPLGYACRLLRKAYRVGARMVVWGPPESVQSLDRLLWTFEPTEFIPHRLVSGAEKAEDQELPIWLLTDLQKLPIPPRSLLNLGLDPVEQLDRFERVIEIVSDQEPHLQAARQRWKRYVAAGHSPEKHEVKEP